MRRICKEVIGVEPVEKMARRAEEKGFRVLRLRGEELSRLKERFGLATFFASIDYMDADRVASEVRKVLEQGGLVFLTVEPENEERIIRAFSGFEVVKRVKKRAYEGQDYICLLLKMI